MLKFAGAALIFLSCIGLAVCIGRELDAHLRLLYEMRELFAAILQEERYGMRPAEHILSGFTLSKEKRLNEFCREVGRKLAAREVRSGEEAWEETAAQYVEKLHLNGEEGRILVEAGGIFFGKSMEESQGKLERIVERLDFLIASEREKKSEKQKVYQTVTVMGGLIVIILLI